MRDDDAARFEEDIVACNTELADVDDRILSLVGDNSLLRLFGLAWHHFAYTQLRLLDIDGKPQELPRGDVLAIGLNDYGCITTPLQAPQSPLYCNLQVQRDIYDKCLYWTIYHGAGKPSYQQVNSLATIRHDLIEAVASYCIHISDPDNAADVAITLANPTPTKAKETRKMTSLIPQKQTRRVGL